MSAVENALDDYQLFAKTTAVFPEVLAKPYLGLGIGDEAGELLEKVAEYDDCVAMSARYRLVKGVLGEVGDVMWYLAMLLLDRGIPLSSVWARSAQFSGEQLPFGTLLATAIGVSIYCSRIQGRVKKEIRDNKIDEALLCEYAAKVVRMLDSISRFFGSNLLLVVEHNRAKLLDRMERGAIKGEGDAR